MTRRKKGRSRRQAQADATQTDQTTDALGADDEQSDETGDDSVNDQQGNEGTGAPGTGQAPGEGQGQPQGQQGQQPGIMLAGQYTKDLSFEAPNAPAIFARLREKAPEITVNVDVTATRLEGNQFEVGLKIGAEAKVEDDTAFIIDLTYCGVFVLNNVPAEHIEPVLLVECPRLLFPFARNIVCDASRDGGFSPLMLQPMDFASLYRQRVQQVQAEKAAAEGNGTDGG